MKTLAAFGHADQAHLLRMRLEGSGIAAHVRDENMVTLDWLASLAVGGVKVDVADEDYEAAQACLEDLGAGAAAEEAPGTGSGERKTD